MVDAIYGSTEADPKILASMSSVFDQVNKVGTEIKTRQTTLQKHIIIWKSST